MARALMTASCLLRRVGHLCDSSLRPVETMSSREVLKTAIEKQLEKHEAHRVSRLWSTASLDAATSRLSLGLPSPSAGCRLHRAEASLGGALRSAAALPPRGDEYKQAGTAAATKQTQFRSSSLGMHPNSGLS